MAGAMAMLSLVQSMQSLGGQGANPVTPKKKAMAQLLPVSNVFAPTASRGNGAVGDNIFTQPNQIINLDRPQERVDPSKGNPDLGAIMGLFSAFSKMKSAPQPSTEIQGGQGGAYYDMGDNGGVSWSPYQPGYGGEWGDGHIPQYPVAPDDYYLR